jgi:hypothetical protein
MSASSPAPSAPASRFAWQPLLRTILVLGMIFGVYRLLRVSAERLPWPDFTSGSFLVGSLLVGVKAWKFWLGVALGGIFVRQHWQLRTWRGFFPGGDLHLIVWMLIFVLAWTTALYPYNFHYGQAHLLDRFLILALGVTTLLRPAFFPIFLFTALQSYNQWPTTALGNPEQTNRKMVLDMAYLLFATGLVRPWIKRFLPGTGQALTIAFVGANLIHYWIPGLAKLEIGSDWLDWTLHNDVGNLIISCYQHGWNLLWDEAGAIRLYVLTAPLGMALKLFTVFIELALLVAFWNRTWFVWLGIGRTLLHLGIFVLSGDIFWNWVLMQVAIVAAFWRDKPQDDADEVEAAQSLGRPTWAIFSLPVTLLSVVYILLTSHSHKASELGWFDSHVTERHNLYAIMKDGRRLYITPTFFEPHDFAFIQSQFQFLQNQGRREGPKVLTRTFGGIHDHEVARQVRAAMTVEEMRPLIEKLGLGSRYPKEDVLKTPAFDLFLQTWMKHHREQNGTIAAVLHFLSPPLHDYVYSIKPAAETYQGEHPVTKIEVEFERTLFDGKAIHLMDRKTIREIPITDG